LKVRRTFIQSLTCVSCPIEDQQARGPFSLSPDSLYCCFSPQSISGSRSTFSSSPLGGGRHPSPQLAHRPIGTRKPRHRLGPRFNSARFGRSSRPFCLIWMPLLLGLRALGGHHRLICSLTGPLRRGPGPLVTSASAKARVEVCRSWPTSGSVDRCSLQVPAGRFNSAARSGVYFCSDRRSQRQHQPPAEGEPWALHQSRPCSFGSEH